ADTVPGYEISQTWGLATPAGTAPAIVTRLSDETAKAMRVADVKERVLGMGAVPAGDTPAEFQAYIDAERKRLGEVIAKTGIVLSD
ncbi:MAG TPA: tripartite tricarboxylate transporter substrate-binding protein, partial [Burkholderiales bacterium]|nr:tripartite tricarboxylate transporter substrate-binding protein [Burkholderiales bacterium]